MDNDNDIVMMIVARMTVTVESCPEFDLKTLGNWISAKRFLIKF